MSYERPIREVYSYLDNTFGGTSVVHNVIGPKGCVGFVRDIETDITTSLVGTSTVPEIAVGISSADSTYGRFRLGTAIGTGYGTGVHRASNKSVVTGNPPRNAQDFAHHIELDGYPLSATVGIGFSGRIPADTAFTITSLLGTGGSPAGGGYVRVTIDWHGEYRG